MILSNAEVPTSGVQLCETSTTTYINNECKGVGTLYITSDNIQWLNAAGEGITLLYPDISIFAVCTDREKCEEDCLFILVKDDNPEPNEDEDADSNDDNPHEAEIRFAPPGGTDIRALFNVLNECNKLHRNENDDMVSDDSEENNEEEEMVVFNGNHVPGQFDDAEEN